MGALYRADFSIRANADWRNAFELRDQGGPWDLTGAAMALAIASAAGNGGDPCVVNIQIVGLTGYNTSSPIGADGENDLAGNGAHSLSLNAAPVSTSYVIAARCFIPPGVEASTATPGTGWTEIYDVTTGGYGDLETQYRTGSTSTTVSWTALSDQGAALEAGIAMALEIMAGLQPAALLIGV